MRGGSGRATGEFAQGKLCVPCPVDRALFEAYGQVEGLAKLLTGFSGLDHYGVRRSVREAILTTIGAEAKHLAALVERWQQEKAKQDRTRKKRA